MSFWVYILRCADGSYYTGHTDNLEKRVAEHQVGGLPGYTLSRRPVALVFSEAFTTREEATRACWACWIALSRALPEAVRRSGILPVMISSHRLSGGQASLSAI